MKSRYFQWRNQSRAFREIIGTAWVALYSARVGQAKENNIVSSNIFTEEKKVRRNLTECFEDKKLRLKN